MSSETPLRIGWDLTEPRTAVSSFLDSLPATPQLLALGEPTHGVNAFPAWRNRIFRTLVEDHGFRSIAVESDLIAGQRVNAHVTAGQGTQAEVMEHGFSHGFGAVPANRELVEWMRAFNAGRESTDHLHFCGFDAPLENLWAASPRASLLALHAFLTKHLGGCSVDTATLETLCGEDARWTTPAAGMDAARSIGDSDGARQLRLLADDLASLLRTEMPGLAARPDFWEAQRHARTATGLLRYHAAMADPAPTRVARMLALRGLMMADHLVAIAEREQERGPTLVFAHNSHLQRPISTMRMRGMSLEWWGAGAHVSTRFGHRYAFIGGHERGSGEPAPDTLAGALGDLARPATLFSSQELTTALPHQLVTGMNIPVTDGVLLVQTAPS